MEREKPKWQKKRDALSLRCTELQETLQSRWSSSHKRLHQEKEKYCNVIVQLLPEWQRAIERQQMQEISQYESKASLIKQRRHSAEIAFEKEKKLLSLLSIRKQEIERLREEEKQDALIRNEERKSISMQQDDFEDTLRSTRYHSFAEPRFQEYVIRKEVTSEMERKFSAQIDDIKSQLLKKRRSSSMDDGRGKDLEPTNITKSTTNSTKTTDSAFHDDHAQNTRGQHRSVSFVEEENVDSDHHHEEKEEMVHDEEHTDTTDEREGNQTQPISNEINVEETQSRRISNDRASAISVLESQQNENERVDSMEQRKETSTKETTDSVEADSLETTEFEEKQIQKSSLTLPVLSSDSDTDGNVGGDGAANDTSQIERAVGLIEIDHGKREDAEKRKAAPSTIPITSENAEEKMYQSPKQKTPPQSQLKLKRSFRARTSRNRLQFSVLASPTQNSEDLDGNTTHNVGVHTETIHENSNKSIAPKISAVKSLHILVIYTVGNQGLCYTEKDPFPQRFRRRTTALTESYSAK